MSNPERAEVSKKNKWWIERHRYFELKHYCRQLPIWRKARNSLASQLPSAGYISDVDNGSVNDPVAKIVEAMQIYDDKMAVIFKAAEETDKIIGPYIIEAVSEGRSYEYLSTCRTIPCCRSVYYDNYRKFFWVLNKLKE